MDDILSASSLCILLAFIVIEMTILNSFGIHMDFTCIYGDVTWQFNTYHAKRYFMDNERHCHAMLNTVSSSEVNLLSKQRNEQPL